MADLMILEHTFKSHGVVPDVIKNLPDEFLKVTYTGTVNADKGEELTPTEVMGQPEVHWSYSKKKYYTIIMTDPDAPSRVEPTLREFKHWLVVNIPGKNVTAGELLAAYVGPGPQENTGLHRYVIMVFKQKSGVQEFEEQYVSNKSSTSRMNFSTQEFAKKYNLVGPVAANFYQAKFDGYVPYLIAQLSKK